MLDIIFSTHQKPDNMETTYELQMQSKGFWHVWSEVTRSDYKEDCLKKIASIKEDYGNRFNFRIITTIIEEIS